MASVEMPREAIPNDSKYLPDSTGHFGNYGGIFVSETLIGPLAELNAAYQKYLHDPEFLAEFDHDLAHFVGRPSPFSTTRLSSYERCPRSENASIGCES